MARSRRSWGSVRKFPSGRYQARYLDPDTRRMVPAPETFASKSAADRWLAKKRAEIDAGTAVDDRAGNRPLSDWWPLYERSIQSAKFRTKAGYSAAWRLRIAPRFGSTPVRRIKPSDVDGWISDMIDAGVSRSQLIETLGVARRVLDLALRDKVITTNPCALRSVTLPKQQQKERPVLSPVEVERLASAMKEERDRMLVRLLAYSGVRIGEALALRWSAVDLDRKVMTIRESVEDHSGTIWVGPTKTYATRTVTLPNALVDQMRTRSSAGLVFPNRKGGYLRYGNWRRDVWDPAAKAARLEVLPHDLRGTCASLLIDAGASVKDVQLHLGHRDTQTTLNIYARVRPGRSVDLANRLDALIAEASPPAIGCPHPRERQTMP